MKKTLLLISFTLLNLGAFAQQAQDPEFESDRPDRTEASSVVPRGYYQLETGFQYQKNRQNGIENKQWLYPLALLRIGVLEKAELRFEATFRREDVRMGETLVQRDKGISTVRVGTKVNLMENQGIRPEMSVLGMLEVPWGDDAFEPKRAAPEIRLLFTNKLSENMTTQYNVGYRRELEDGQMVNKLQYTLSLSRTLSHRFSLFAEVFGDKIRNSHPIHQVDGGVQFMLLPNLQLDAIVGTGISSKAPELFMGAGVSVRLPR